MSVMMGVMMGIIWSILESTSTRQPTLESCLALRVRDALCHHEALLCSMSNMQCNRHVRMYVYDFVYVSYTHPSFSLSGHAN